MTALAPTSRACCSISANASPLAVSHSSVSSVMLPPISVCSPAPIEPITDRDRTVMPRTTPSDFVVRYPSSAFAVVVIARDSSAMATSYLCRLKADLQDKVSRSSRLPVAPHASATGVPHTFAGRRESGGGFDYRFATNGRMPRRMMEPSRSGPVRREERLDVAPDPALGGAFTEDGPGDERAAGDGVDGAGHAERVVRLELARGDRVLEQRPVAGDVLLRHLERVRVEVRIADVDLEERERVGELL